MFFRLRLYHSFFFFLFCSTIAPLNLFAVGLQASLTLEQPESGYFLPGESFTATLSLFDNDGAPLYANEAGDNGIRTIQLWISGPKHDYNGLEGYSGLIIVAYQGVYQPDAGFNPETGEIEITIPEELDALAAIQFSSNVSVSHRIPGTVVTQSRNSRLVQQSRLETHLFGMLIVQPAMMVEHH